MTLPTITGTFRVVSAPELRFTAAGKAVATLTVITNERRKNAQTDEWEDGDGTPFLNVTVWEKAAEALAEMDLTTKDKVLVTGQFFQRKYEKRDSTEGVAYEIKNATVARIAPVKYADRNTGQSQQAYPGGSHTPDPWAAPARTDDAPPF